MNSHLCRARHIALLPALAAVLALSACGSDDGASTDAADSASPNPSSSAAADPGSSEAPDAGDGDDASSDTGSEPKAEDYIALADDLTEAFENADPSVDPMQEPDQFFPLPDGVSVFPYKSDFSALCIQDENTQRAFELKPNGSDGESDGILYDGRCRGGDVVARIISTGPGDDDYRIKGDKDVAAPFAAYIAELG